MAVTSFSVSVGAASLNVSEWKPSRRPDGDSELPALVFIPGLWATAQTFHPLLAKFAATTDQRGGGTGTEFPGWRRILAISARGHGRSPRNEAILLNVSECAYDVVSVLTSLNIDRAVLFGHGLGAHVALHASALSSDVVAGIVLSSAARVIRSSADWGDGTIEDVVQESQQARHTLDCIP
eukprot:6207795-Pleurochrysis_carterae.AAC.3